MNSLTTKIATLGVVGIVSVGAFAGAAVAQEDSGSGDTAVTQESDSAEGRSGVRHRPEVREHFKANLAEELGLTTDELESAWEAAKEATKAEAVDELTERLQAKVDAGEITQEQMDEILERVANGERPFDRGDKARPTVEQLTERLQAKVDAGEITQEQMDEILEQIANGERPTRPGRQGPPAAADATSTDA